LLNDIRSLGKSLLFIAALSGTIVDAGHSRDRRRRKESRAPLTPNESNRTRIPEPSAYALPFIAGETKAAESTKANERRHAGQRRPIRRHRTRAWTTQSEAAQRTTA
jgi:hypothetical protein